MIQATTAPLPGRTEIGYFERAHPAFLILASFLVLTVPMCVLGVIDPEWVRRYYLKPVFLWLLGVTHFVVTLTIYFQSSNLRYFAATWKNRLVYFLIPIAIMVFFDLYAALDLSIAWPALNIVVLAGVRFAENAHVCRQSYGVTQLFKRRAEQLYPPWMKDLEYYYFWVMTGVLWLTFLAGGFDRRNLVVVAGAALMVAMLVGLLVGHALTWQHTRDRAVVAPCCYLMFQTGSAALAMYDMSLYIFCLAMHYVEYHVLMAPRCFDVPLDPKMGVNRFFGRMRQEPGAVRRVAHHRGRYGQFYDSFDDGCLRRSELEHLAHAVAGDAGAF